MDTLTGEQVTEIAAVQAVDADPAANTTIELALDTAHAATIRFSRACARWSPRPES